MQTVAPVIVGYAVPRRYKHVVVLGPLMKYPASPHARRILVLDDHAGSRAVMCRALELRGYVCWEASDEASARSVIAASTPDVVLFEWHLERRPARGLAARLRGLARTPMRVIAVSTMDEPADFRDQEGVDGYLTKPIDLDALDRILHETPRSSPVG